MERLLRNTKRTGRCNLHGHGNCEVSQDMSQVVVSRTTEKKIVNQKILDEIENCSYTYGGHKNYFKFDTYL